MDAIEKAITAIVEQLPLIEATRRSVATQVAIRGVLLEFFKDRAIDILTEFEKRDLMLDDMDIKIGGTD